MKIVSKPDTEFGRCSDKTLKPLSHEQITQAELIIGVDDQDQPVVLKSRYEGRPTDTGYTKYIIFDRTPETEKPAVPVYTKVIQFFDYFEVQEEVERRLGKKVRNYAGWKPISDTPNDPPYLDFWHRVLEWMRADETYNKFYNGATLQLRWRDMRHYFADRVPDTHDLLQGVKDYNWVLEILDVFIDVVKEKDPDVEQDDDAGLNYYHFFW